MALWRRPHSAAIFPLTGAAAERQRQAAQDTPSTPSVTMDPLSVIFVPGGFAAALTLLSPLGFLAHRLWRRRGHRRNAARCCGRCDSGVTLADELYWFDGLLVCARCAITLRRRLWFGLPCVAVVALGFAISSGTALITSVAGGGPGLAWWLDGRWIPLLLPSVGLGIATAAVVARGKQANRLAIRRFGTTAPLGRDPDAPVQLRIRARDT